MPYQINKCLCFGRGFDELREIAEAHGATTIEELQQHVKFGQNCMLCHPYVRRMLRTGEVVFKQIVTDADEPSRGADG